MNVLQLLSEFFLILTYPLANIIKFFFPLREKKQPIRNNENSTSTILIFEQWFAQNLWHIYIKWYLERKGFTVYWTNFSLLKGSHHDAAKYLSKYIEKHRLHNITLVGVSMGAVSSLLYLQEYDGWVKVRKFISIGGPLKGTPLAFLIYFLTPGRQVLPNSTFIKNLVGNIKHPERIVCISAKFDEFVPHWSNTVPHAYNRVVDIVGHNNLHVISKSVFSSIAKEAVKEV